MNSLFSRTIATCLLAGYLSSAMALPHCEANVDSVEPLYINGMFTLPSDFKANMRAIDEYLLSHLGADGYAPNTWGAHNRSKNLIAQVIEVAAQKYGDYNANQEHAIEQFLTGGSGYLSNPEGVQAVQQFLSEIAEHYQAVLEEEDGSYARDALRILLDTCSRIVLIGHSQGNFYGNATFNDAYVNYVFPNGYSLAKYPMLGMMQIASPVYSPGGAAGAIYPDAIGHLTNNHDRVMALMRNTLGAVEANFSSNVSEADPSGHTLINSYLRQPAQAAEIIGQMRRIVRKLTPYPIHGQLAASSSALSGFGRANLNQLLDVEFTTGSIYRYSGVSRSVFDGLLGAHSQGVYFNSAIRDAFTYEKIEE